jgi:hypothetical protein
MMPATLEEVASLGYSKFHLGAVLIRDGFVEYDRLMICDEILQYLRSKALQAVADRILLDEMEYYHDRLQMFCDVMADLGLYNAMVKCRELLYLEDSEDEDSQSNGDSQSDTSGEAEAYVPPPPLPSVDRTPAPITCEFTPGLSSSRVKPVLPPTSVDPPPAPKTAALPVPKAAVGAPSPKVTLNTVAKRKVTTPVPSQKSATTPIPTKLSPKKAKPTKAAPAKPVGLYAQRDDDDDDESTVEGASKSSASSVSKDSTTITETSYFNNNPVWEQEQGQNSQKYTKFGSYYHGNPNDWMVSRKAKSEENPEAPSKSEVPESRKKDQQEAPKSPKKELPKPAKKETPKSPKREGKKKDKPRSPKKEAKKKAESSPKSHKSPKSPKKENKKGSDEPQKEPALVKKTLQPLPKAYPPPPPKKTNFSTKPNPVKRKNEIPVSISLPQRSDDEDENDEAERKPAYLSGVNRNLRPSMMRGSSFDTEEPEELGMESAHGCMAPGSPSKAIDRNLRPVTMRGSSFDSGKDSGEVTDGEATTESRRRSRRRGRKPNADEESVGPPQWDSVLGPTDGGGRPEVFRGMSVASLAIDDKVAVPKDSLLAPDDAEDEEADDPSVVPLTPSQIKAQQPRSAAHAPPSPYQSPPLKPLLSKAATEPEDDSGNSNQTSPTVSSTVEDEAISKEEKCSPPLPSEKKVAKSPSAEPKRAPLKRSDARARHAVKESTPKGMPTEIAVPDEGASSNPPLKPSEIKARNNPKLRLSKEKSGLDRSLSKSSNQRNNGGNRGMPLESTPQPPNAHGFSETTAPVKEITIGGPQMISIKTNDGTPQELEPPRQTKSGLKDYTRKKRGEEDDVVLLSKLPPRSASTMARLPPRTKSGLKDYSRRTDKVNSDRTANVPNHGSTDLDFSKDKQHPLDSDGRSVASGDFARKPAKKELKISMSSKEPPPRVIDAQTPEKKVKKETKNKETREVPLSEEEKVLMRKKCYMWYARMSQPDRDNMKRRVAALPPHCNIYVEDVDLLPWICYGTVLSVKAMTELFMGDDAE